MDSQRTIAKEVAICGTSLHLGSESCLTFKPAPPDTGIVFVRTDLPESPKIKASIDDAIGGVIRRTSIGHEEVIVHTIEHVMAALAGLQIDNLIIESNAPEPPAMDGSALPFVDVLKDAGIVEQKTQRREIPITEPISVSRDGRELIVIPNDNHKITYTFKVDEPIQLTQMVSLELNEDTFVREIAPARTFCFQYEIESLKSRGLGKGGSSENVVIINDDGVPDHEPRFQNEMARHKILDLIGDLYLLGSIPKAHIIGIKSGHNLNADLIQKISESYRKYRRMNNIPTIKPLDINEIKRILPHRYPFLLIDRVIELKEDKMAVGIKNATGNEEFFQGHFPQVPIMPGVLQVEALAQLAGILLLKDKKDDNTLGFFRTIENVKFRRPVVPGDQLRLEVQVLKRRGNLAKFSGQIFVNAEMTTEAEFTIAL